MEGLRPRVRPTAEGTVALWFTGAFAAVALVLGDNLVFLIGCLFIGVLGSSAFLARRNARGILVRRMAPARGRVGQPVPLAYEVANPRRRAALGIEVYDHLPSAVRPVWVDLEFPGVGAGGTARAETHVRFLRRGLHRLGGLDVASRYPLGVFRADAAEPASALVLVRPREGRPTGLLLAHLAGRTQEAARRVRAARGQDALYGVREFREGDDPRRIHWRSTARRGVVTVSEWRAEEGRQVVVVLGRSQGAGAPSVRSFERAVSAAATVWRLAQRRGLPATLVTGEVDEAAPSGRRAFEHGLDVLARVRGQGGRRPKAAVEALAKRPGSRCLVFVASGPEAALGKALAAAAGPGGEVLLLRADQPSLSRWIRDLQ